MARAVDVRPEHLLRLAGPQPVIGCGVERNAAPFDGARERSRIPKIANHGFDPVEFAQALRIADQHAHPIAAIQKLPCDVPADESSCARDKNRPRQRRDVRSLGNALQVLIGCCLFGPRVFVGCQD